MMPKIDRKILSFLFCGGLAALVNWAARIGLSLWLPFWLAIVVAYIIGMGIGFALYKNFVWADRKSNVSTQLTGFIAVNALSSVVVLLTALLTAELFRLFASNYAVAEALAHGLAIGVGAVANYVGHNRITFAPDTVRHAQKVI